MEAQILTRSSGTSVAALQYLSQVSVDPTGVLLFSGAMLVQSCKRTIWIPPTRMARVSSRYCVQFQLPTTLRFMQHKISEEEGSVQRETESSQRNLSAPWFEM